MASFRDAKRKRGLTFESFLFLRVLFSSIRSIGKGRGQGEGRKIERDARCVRLVKGFKKIFPVRV